jgi:arylsulfatase A-like enzyme
MQCVCFIAVYALSFCWIKGSVFAAVTSKPPNVLVILTDDMDFSDIGCFGGEIRTPKSDCIAAGGLRFTQFYNSARCCPTRASMLTDLYPHQASVGHMVDDKGLDGYHGDLSRNAVTIAEVLKTVGYATYAVGKWHVTPFLNSDSKHNWLLQRGFSRYYGIIGGAANYFDPPTLVRDNTPIKASEDKDYKPEQYYLTDAIIDHAVRFIDDHAAQKAGQPFFLYTAYTAAHWPLHALESEITKHKGKYDTGYDPIRQARFEQLRQMQIIQLGWDLNTQDSDWSKVWNKAWEARCMEVYAVQVDRMDQGVGKIIESLKKNSLFQNTLIIYLQDNGACAELKGRPANSKGTMPPMPGPADSYLAYGQSWANVSNTPFRYNKHYLHEGGISTPLIVHWPAGIQRRGELEHQPGHLIDIMATCVEVSGAVYPKEFDGKKIQPMEGRSLVPAFHGQTIQRDAIFWEHEGNRALRIGR